MSLYTPHATDMIESKPANDNVVLKLCMLIWIIYLFNKSLIILLPGRYILKRILTAIAQRCTVLINSINTINYITLRTRGIGSNQLLRVAITITN